MSTGSLLCCLAPGWRNGRRDGFKIRWRQLHEGSSPLPGTTRFFFGRRHRANPPNPMDTLARALLPTLLHELANTTQLLTGLHALTTMADGEELLANHEEELARAGNDAQRLGWLLGVLGAAGGHDVLLARREQAGLDWIVSLVTKAARREERPLPTAPATLPRLMGCTPDGWSVPWAVGSLLWQVGEQPNPGAWNFRMETEGWRLALPGCDPAELVERVPGAKLVDRTDGPGADLLLPAGYLSQP